MNYFFCLLNSCDKFKLIKKLGRVHELLINSEKASTSPVSEENGERFLCLRFSITHTHDLFLKWQANKDSFATRNI